MKLSGPGGTTTYSGSAIDVPVTLASGVTTWTISGASGVKWTLKLTYPV